jgi:hypothetical protein
MSAKMPARRDMKEEATGKAGSRTVKIVIGTIPLYADAASRGKVASESVFVDIWGFLSPAASTRKRFRPAVRLRTVAVSDVRRQAVSDSRADSLSYGFRPS